MRKLRKADSACCSKDKSNKISARNWAVIWIAGLAGQLAWNVENQWFNTFIYAKIAPTPNIITAMVAVTACVCTFCTFAFGTLGDRMGKRKPLVVWGYIIWGITTITFGLTEFMGNVTRNVLVLGIMVVFADSVMSLFGAMGNDAGFNPWTTDITNERNRGSLGAVVSIQAVLAAIVGTLIGGFIIDKLDYLGFFIIFGVFFIITGIFCQFAMKDSPTLKPDTQSGSYWKQFIKPFNFRLLKKNKLLFIVLTIFTVFFISFNVYFTHILNFLIYTYDYSAGDSGVLLGVGLLVAAPLTLAAIKFINKGKFVHMSIFAILVNALGLAVMMFADMAAASGKAALTATIIIAIILVGGGYMVIYQTLMVWCKNLYPEDQRGQLEGVRLFFYVLLPMVIGPLIANPIINLHGKDITIQYPTGAITGKSPSVEIFYAAFALVFLTFIPLYFAYREEKKIKLAAAALCAEGAAPEIALPPEFSEEE